MGNYYNIILIFHHFMTFIMLLPHNVIIQDPAIISTITPSSEVGDLLVDYKPVDNITDLILSEDNPDADGDDTDDIWDFEAVPSPYTEKIDDN
eukprot:UN05501